jgi:Resolvase, N terminal domain
LIEELARAGVETLFIRSPRATTAEDQLLPQFQGMIAEYERAQILERSRRGKRHRARQGQVSVLSGAPFGYRYVRKSEQSAAYRLSVYSSRSLVGLHLLEGFPDFLLRDVKRLCLGHRTPPVTGWLCVAAEQCSPFDPAPLQNFSLYYELLRPCAPHRYSDPCGSSRSDVSVCIGATGSHVPYKSLIRLRAAYVPDVARAVFRTAPELIPGAR